MVNENTDISEPEEFHEDNMPAPKGVTSNNYPGNTHRAKMQQSKSESASAADVKKIPEGKIPLKKVIQGDAVERKKGIGRKIADTFKGDDVNSVGNYILIDIVVPAIKSMISDAVRGGTDRLLFGGSAPSRPTSGTANRISTYTNYNRVNNPAGRAGEADGPRSLSGRARANHEFSEIVLGTRGEAEMVLEALNDAVNQYGTASVSDFYDLVGFTGTFTDQKWGWTNLVGSGIRPVRDGYIVNLPKTQPIE